MNLHQIETPRLRLIRRNDEDEWWIVSMTDAEVRQNRADLAVGYYADQVTIEDFQPATNEAWRLDQEFYLLEPDPDRVDDEDE